MRVPVSFLLPLALALAGCAGVSPPSGSAGPPATARQLDERLAAVTERLALAAVRRCPDPVGRTGLAIHALDQYTPRERDDARARFALGDTAGVMAVVPGSAADRAGVRADDRLVAADGIALPRSGSGGADFATVAATLDALEATAADGALALTVERAGVATTLRLSPPPGCRARAVLTGVRRAEASTDGVYLKASAGLLAEVPDEAELAAVVAHELAHIVLAHRQAIRAGIARVRDTEEEADRLSVALLADAGYDPTSAARFWRRFGPAHDGLFGDPTHGGWRERAARLDEAVAALPTTSPDPISSAKETGDGE